MSTLFLCNLYKSSYITQKGLNRHQNTLKHIKNLNLKEMVKTDVKIKKDYTLVELKENIYNLFEEYNFNKPSKEE